MCLKQFLAPGIQETGHLLVSGNAGHLLVSGNAGHLLKLPSANFWKRWQKGKEPRFTVPRNTTITQVQITLMKTDGLTQVQTSETAQVSECQFLETMAICKEPRFTVPRNTTITQVQTSETTQKHRITHVRTW
jgi:hypothetical protein